MKITKALVVLLVMALICMTLVACSNSYSTSACTHSWSEWSVSKEPTCIDDGEESRICVLCGDEQKETIPANGHEYDAGTIVVQPTHTTTGTKEYQCRKCGATKNETIPEIHNYNYNGICIECGKEEQVELTLSDEEINEAKKIHWISNRYIDVLTNEQRLRFSFSLKDEYENYLKVPTIVDIKIVNDNNETVYKRSRIVKVSDYKTFYKEYDPSIQWIAAAVYIDFSSILEGSSVNGTIYYKVHNDYANFSEYKLDITNGLPVKQANIVLPSLPCTVSDCSTAGYIYYSVKITNIEYEIIGEDLYVYVSGEKTYDYRENESGDITYIAIKLYDSQGNLVADNFYFSLGRLNVGDTFKGKWIKFNDCIAPGETYTVLLVNR